MRILFVLFVACAALAGGCVARPSSEATGPYDDAGPPGAPCVLTTDCRAGELCSYPIDAGCAATGVCVIEDLRCTNDGPVVCDCAGDPVGLACVFGAGNAPSPVPSVAPGCSSVDAGID